MSYHIRSPRLKMMPGSPRVLELAHDAPNVATRETTRPTEPLSPNVLLELIEVRRLFEPAIASLAATRVAEDYLTEIAALLEAMTAARDDAAAFGRLDIAFHRTVTFATGNDALARLFGGVPAQTALAWIPRGVLDEDTADTVVAEHAAIHAALASRDPVLAHAAALIHVSTAEKWLRRSLLTPPS